MAMVLTMLVLLVAASVLGYFWWSEKGQALVLREEVAQLESSLQSRRSEFQESTTALNEEKSTNFRLSQQLRKLSADVEAQKTELEAAKSAQSKAEEGIKKLTAQLSNDKAALAAEKQSLAVEKESLEQAKTALEQQIAAATAEFEAEKTVWLAEKEALEEDKATAAQENTELNTTVAALQSELEQASVATTQTQAELASLKEQRLADQSRFDDEKARWLTIQADQEKMMSDLKQALAAAKARVSAQASITPVPTDNPAISVPK
jgi:chromosome segregation ATPase